MVPVLSMLSFFETWMLSAMKQATQDCFLEIHNVPLDIHVCWGGGGRAVKQMLSDAFGSSCHSRFASLVCGAIKTDFR